MLVLARKTQESIMIGNFLEPDQLVTIMVLEIRGGRVRLGFEVLGNVAVHRSEVWQRVHFAKDHEDVSLAEFEFSATR